MISKCKRQANDIILKEDGTFINDKKVLAELFNGYFVNILGDAGETAIKMDYAADFMEHPSIGAIKHYRIEKETFRFEPVNSPKVKQLLFPKLLLPKLPQRKVSKGMC